MTYRYMLDTNIVSNTLRYPHGPASHKFRSFAPSELAVSVVVMAELRFGASKIGSRKLHAQIDAASTLFDVLALDLRIVDFYCALRVALEQAGTPIGANDLFIAAHALALDLTLVTDNVGEFSRVPGLRIENWLD